MIRQRARQFEDQRWRWLSVVAVLATGVSSYEAVAETIPFRLDNESTAVARCVACNGPWSRSSGWNMVDADTNKEFYSATANLFSPFGSWFCRIAELNAGGCDFQFVTPAFIADVGFCLPNPPVTPSVQLTVTPDGRSLTASYPNGDCDNSAASSFLGDNSRSARASRSHRGGKLDPDGDSFGFTAEAGDALQIGFVGHEQDGYQDGDAALSLLDGDGAVVERVAGAPPLHIATVAPQGGDYRIVVQQADDADETSASGPFRGAYRLSLVSSGAAPLLTPDPDVER